MKRFLIEEVKCGVANSCPMMGLVITSVRYNDGRFSRWLNLSELDGIPCFSITDSYVFEELIENDWSEEFTEEMHKSFIMDFQGVTLGEYDEIFESFYEEDNEHNPAVPFIRYVIAVTRCDFDEFESLRQMAIGHYADEIEQIISDVEDEYLYDREFDDENV
jgi:hypothetical protein